MKTVVKSSVPDGCWRVDAATRLDEVPGETRDQEPSKADEATWAGGDTSMTTVAFIGLGIMGLPMAKNLLAAGFDVVGHNRSKGKVDTFVEAGGKGADSAVEAARGAEVVITMLPDSPDVEAVLLGTGEGDGVLAHVPEGTLVVDMSTIRPDTARHLAEVGGPKGLGVLDAPVSGGDQGAIDGTLSIMVGASDADFERAKPLFEAMGKVVAHVGPAGAGQTVKAANQLIGAGNLELVAEALVFLEAHGVDTRTATRVLAGGMAGSAMLERKGPAMLARDFEPGFRVELHHKDLGIVQAAAREAGVTIPLGAVVSQLMGSLVAQGHGGLDHTALVTLVEQLSGRDGRT
jgi:2-hydroxy-3-oxopropionate reductase